MSMLNQAAVEALCSATYLENYLDTMENLPNDLQRVVTQMRELDIQCRDIMQDIEYHQDIYSKEVEGVTKKKALMSIQRALIRCQEIGDEKLGLMAVIADHIENRQRQLEQDRENLDPTSSRDIEKEEQSLTIVTQTRPVKQEEKVDKVPMKRQRRQKTTSESITKEEEKKDVIQDKGPKKKKKRKASKKEQAPASPVEPPIDPDEPIYCLCEQVSYGEMIGCDNDACVIEWFHFNCVGLVNKPKGRWFCPNCRGENSKVMRKFDK